MKLKVFSGNSVPELSQLIADYLCIDLSCAQVGRFRDGEISVKINEDVRNNNIFIIQSICLPINDNLMELILLIDALRSSSVGFITAVIPYFGYARQDRRINFSKVPITIKLIANFLFSSGIDHILSIDLHTEQIKGFFSVPIDNLCSSYIFLEDILKKKIKNPVIVSPDVGGINRARKIAKLLNNADIAIIDKYRFKKNSIKKMNLIGNVSNRNCIIIDDIIDTGNTLYNTANILKKKNVKNIFAYTTHAIFSDKMFHDIAFSIFDEIIVSDSVKIKKEIYKFANISILSLSKILAKAIFRINKLQSISTLVNT